MRAGSLGAATYAKGSYFYLGSALNGLVGRVGRHLTQGKRLRWHIDALTEVSCPVWVWWREGPERLECHWARNVLSAPGSQIPVPRFGASDCRCPSHLVFFPDTVSPAMDSVAVPTMLMGAAAG